MAFIGLYLCYIILVLLFIIYSKLIYQCKRGVKVSVEVLRSAGDKNGNSKSALKVDVLPQPPGPLPLPILGNLALLGQYAVPFEGFSELSKIYGDVYSLTLGTTRCVVVNGLDNIREVLNQNGKYFGGRPNFERWHRIFGGDRNNSLALCDWSSLQQKRRNLARKHCSPRDNSSFFQKMNDAGCLEIDEFMRNMKTIVNPQGETHLKPFLMEACANLFLSYMCSTRFDYEDAGFKGMVRCFDEIFWEINQGYAIDFLPWLSPFYASHLKSVESYARTIREFILERVIEPRAEKLHERSEDDDDFTDALLRSLSTEENVTKTTILFMLEDFIGGHSAIGNLVYIALGHIAKYPEIGKKIQDEVAKITKDGKRKITLVDTEDMPYTVATIYEVLRFQSSPIVPHVATENSQICGYGVEKDTIIFINNYLLNTSENYWDDPKEFNPERFLETVAANKIRKDAPPSAPSVVRVKKNIPHFLPFSVGKRTCIGQNLVRGYSFLLLANILESYDVTSSNPELIKVYPACVAVPPKTFSLKLIPRN